MELKSENFCPLVKKTCLGLKCAWFIKVCGTNPNTGKEVEEWGCAMQWVPLLLIENSGQQRQTGAAVESFRNEMVKANKASRDILSQTMITANEAAQRAALKHVVDPS